jgi:RNA polymerase subunit RPABC4/transcription elongation factor Spt4
MTDEQNPGGLPTCKKCGRMYLFGEKKLCPECREKSSTPKTKTLITIDMNNIDYRLILDIISDDRFNEKKFNIETLKRLISEAEE